MSLEPSTTIKHYFGLCFPRGSLSSYSVSVSRQLLKLLYSSYLFYSELKPETPGQTCTTWFMMFPVTRLSSVTFLLWSLKITIPLTPFTFPWPTSYISLIEGTSRDRGSVPQKSPIYNIIHCNQINMSRKPKASKKIAHLLGEKNLVRNQSVKGSCGIVLKNPPANQETWVQSLGEEDPLEKEMTTHSSILAWKIPWTEEPSELQSMRSQRVRWQSDWAHTLERILAKMVDLRHFIFIVIQLPRK